MRRVGSGATDYASGRKRGDNEKPARQRLALPMSCLQWRWRWQFIYTHPRILESPSTEPCAAHPLLLHMTKGASSTRTLRRRRRGCVLVPTARASVNDAVSSYCLLCAVRAHLSFFCLCALPCGPSPDQGIYFWGTIGMPRCPALVPVSESASGICVHVACMCLYMYVAQRLYG